MDIEFENKTLLYLFSGAENILLITIQKNMALYNIGGHSDKGKIQEVAPTFYF